jgi:Ulp1 family protease
MNACTTRQHSATDKSQMVQGLRYRYPEEQMVGAVEVTGHDLLTLRPFEFVNDTIMDYYSKKIANLSQARQERGESRVKLHWFNSFFYKKLTEKCKDALGADTAYSWARFRELALFSTGAQI